MAAPRARRRLAVLLGLLFIALAVPSAVLLVQMQRQIKFEAFHQYRTLADELGLRIDAELQRLIAAEEARGYGDYRFVVVAGDSKAANFLQRSALARYPVRADLPGVIGYFQVAADGEFTTPLLPDDLANPARWGLDAAELAQRTALRDQLLDVLRRNELLERHAAPVDVLADANAADGRRDPKKQDAVTAAQRRINTGQESTAAASSGNIAATDKVVSVTAPDKGVNAARGAGETAPPKGQGDTTDGTTAEMKDNPAPERQRAVASQAAFDQLNTVSTRQSKAPANELGKVDDLRLGRTYQNDNTPVQAQQAPPAYEQKLKAALPNRVARKEQATVVDADTRHSSDSSRVRTFESELDPFEFSLLDDGHGVLFRKVWRDGKRTIQGLILDQAAFFGGALVKPFEETALAQMSDMVVAYRHDVLRVARATDTGNDGYGRLSLSRGSELRGELLHQQRLSAPFGDVQLLWNIRHLPAGPGGRVVTWAGGVLLVLLVLSFALLYRLGLRQLLLARQQQDFVSAVSHELNTPLTSIRMYAEILREGWAGADKQREYYAYIHAESERLSRLIANVLQLARMERRELALDLKPMRIATLLDLLRSKLASQVERSGFTVHYTLDPACAEREVQVDADAFVQILINLVDNALKFAAKAERREIDIAVRAQGNDTLWHVRDYGPGVEKSQMKKIFQLFYRPGSELTRETLGTGIGLALVRQLARAMHGEADVVQREPGAEFVLRLPLLPDASSGK